MTTYNPEYHPQKVLELMESGCLNVEIQAIFGISRQTWNNWKERYPSFREAVETGEPKVEVKTVIEPLKQAIARGKDGAVKSIQLLARNKFGYDPRDDAKTVNNTQINIKITNLEEYKELEEQLKAQIIDLNLIEDQEEIIKLDDSRPTTIRPDEDPST